MLWIKSGKDNFQSWSLGGRCDGDEKKPNDNTEPTKWNAKTLNLFRFHISVQNSITKCSQLLVPVNATMFCFTAVHTVFNTCTQSNKHLNNKKLIQTFGFIQLEYICQFLPDIQMTKGTSEETKQMYSKSKHLGV